MLSVYSTERSVFVIRSALEVCPVISWVLGVGCWVLGVGCWVLGVGCWVLGVGCWVLGVGCCCCCLVVGCWLLVVGCWLLVVGCWLLFLDGGRCWMHEISPPDAEQQRLGFRFRIESRSSREASFLPLKRVLLAGSKKKHNRTVNKFSWGCMGLNFQKIPTTELENMQNAPKILSKDNLLDLFWQILRRTSKRSRDSQLNKII